MFVALQTLLATLASLTVSLVDNKDGTITVTVIPKGGKDGSTLDTPLALTDTPENLDAEFAAILTSYTNKRQTLSDQLAATEAIIEAAQKEAAEKAKKTVTKSSKKPAAATTANTSETPGDDESGNGDDDDDENSSSVPSSPAPATPAAPVDASAPAAKSADASNVWE